MIKPDLVDQNVINLMKHNLIKCKTNSKIYKQIYINRVAQIVTVGTLILFFIYKYRYRKTPDEKIRDRQHNQELLFKKIKEIQINNRPVKEITDMITDMPIWK